MDQLRLCFDGLQCEQSRNPGEKTNSTETKSGHTPFHGMAQDKRSKEPEQGERLEMKCLASVRYKKGERIFRSPFAFSDF
jgi:hypothetical protein